MTASPAAGKLVYKISEAAEALCCCRSQVYAMIHSGALPHLRIGRAYRVPVEAVQRMIAQSLEGR